MELLLEAGVFMAIMVAAFLSFPGADRARRLSALSSNMMALQQAVHRHAMDLGRYPTAVLPDAETVLGAELKSEVRVPDRQTAHPPLLGRCRHEPLPRGPLRCGLRW